MVGGSHGRKKEKQRKGWSIYHVEQPRRKREEKRGAPALPIAHDKREEGPQVPSLFLVVLAENFDHRARKKRGRK